MFQEVHQKLKNRKLKVTRVRVNVLQAFLQSKHALSYTDLCKQLPVKEDKVTVYRTLKKFTEFGLIHEIEDENANKFALCTHNCSAEHHKDSHAHFKCTQCMHIYCLDTPKVNLDVPTGFQIHQYNLRITGTCAVCIN